MKDITFINVSGFHNSGSSAVVNFLKEVEGVYECGAEMRLVKDPYGLAHLERELTSDYWGLINASAAVTDFLSYAKICSRYGKSPLSPAGLSYASTINPDFMKITKEFVDEICDYEFKTDFYHYKFKKSYFKYVTDRIRNGIDKKFGGKLGITNKNIETCYYAHPTQERFDEAVKNYFDKLFSIHVEDDVKSYILMDQTISPNNTTVIDRFFHKAKLIIVGRDPRDMYINDLQRGIVHNGTKEEGEDFARRQHDLRDNITYTDNVMYVTFEELMMEFEQISKRILDFIGLPYSAHTGKGKYLDMEKSVKNVGLWKDKYEQYKDALDAIAANAPEYCYNG